MQQKRWINKNCKLIYQRFILIITLLKIQLIPITLTIKIRIATIKSTMEDQIFLENEDPLMDLLWLENEWRCWRAAYQSWLLILLKIYTLIIFMHKLWNIKRFVNFEILRESQNDKRKEEMIRTTPSMMIIYLIPIWYLVEEMTDGNHYGKLFVLYFNKTVQ